MFMLLAIWLQLNQSFNYKGFCTCMQVTVFKEFKVKFLMTSNFLKEFKDELEACLFANVINVKSSSASRSASEFRTHPSF